MKQKICFDAKKLCSLLSDYELRSFNVNHSGEEYECTEYTYYFCRPNVISITRYSSAFSDSMYIKLDDGIVIKAESNNVHYADKDDSSIIRINNNDYVSPALICDGDRIESTSELLMWLSRFNITQDELDELSTTLTIYGEIEYPGVSTPEYSRSGHWTYSSKPLVLSEQEIEIVLNSIDDPLLRKKIDCILHARVFKRKYY